jgi:hypothetical protein
MSTKTTAILACLVGQTARPRHSHFYTIVCGMIFIESTF